MRIEYGTALSAVLVDPNTGEPLIAGGFGSAGAVVAASYPAMTTASAQILAANANRKGFSIWNDSAGILYINLLGTTASATVAQVPLAAGAFYESAFPLKTAITGILSTGTGNARVAEYT